MRILSIVEKEKLEIKNVTKPVAGDGEALIKMVTCGICGSDVTAYRGVNPTVKYPIEGLGHEGVGIIEEIGLNDKELKVGDRVVLEPYVPCNECHMCKAGRYNNCAHLKVCGVHKNGMMAEYFVHPIQLLYKIPEELDDIKSCMVEPLTIGLHAVTRAKVTKGEVCLIFGAGTIGVMAAFGCISYGATPILVDVIDVRLKQAKEYGITHVFNSKEENLLEYLMDITKGKLPEALIDCTGAKSILENMHEYVCHGARISLVGWPHGPVSINTVRCMQKELNIYPCRNSNQKFTESIELIQSGEIPVQKMITKVVKFEETESTIIDMINNPENYMKVVVKIKEEE